MTADSSLLYFHMVAAAEVKGLESLLVEVKLNRLGGEQGKEQ